MINSDNTDDLYGDPGGSSDGMPAAPVFDPFAPIAATVVSTSHQSQATPQQQQQQHQSASSASHASPSAAAAATGASAAPSHQQLPNSSTTTTAPQGGQRIDVKLFVGRLPKSIEADAVQQLFAEYGEVLEVVIIRNKTTQQHKGSAFVRMASLTEADAAVRALANQRVIDPQLGALQVRYANGEVERLGLLGDAAEPGKDLGKLFIGSLPRGLSEDAIRPLFEPFGPIQEIVLMKDNTTGSTKGCGFVKYEFKEHALQAVRALHESQTMEGVPRPLEVKFAENKRAAAAAAAAVAASATSSAVPGGASVSSGGYGGVRVAAAAAASNAQPRQANGWTEYFTPEGRPYYHHEMTQRTQWTVPPGFAPMEPALAAQAVGGGMAASTATAVTVTPTAGQTGPLGANVFVFHIPPEWGQAEVTQHFAPFGEILSCYVAADRSTGRNKGYAFVSYATIESACQAVHATNGQPVGCKRLKVSIKTGEESYAAPFMPAAAAQYAPADMGYYQQYGAASAYGYGMPPLQGGGQQPQQQPQQQYAAAYRSVPY